MTRIDTIIQLDTAITTIESVKEQLINMACTGSLNRRFETLLQQLDNLRIDILQTDLPGEQ